MDRWITEALADVLRAAERPLVVDLGYGASPVTTIELYRRVRSVAPDAEVTGLEIDPGRVTRRPRPPCRAARRGRRPARPVLRGRRLRTARAAPAGARARVQRAAPVPGGTRGHGLVPPPGRPGARRPAGGGHLRRDRPPRRLGHAARHPAATSEALITFSARLASLDRPSDLAERLPKALIHRNVPGEPVHQFLRDLDRAWDHAAPYSAFGPRQRWLTAIAALSADWPVLRQPPRGGPRRWRLGELTLPWQALRPPTEGGSSAESANSPFYPHSSAARRCANCCHCTGRGDRVFQAAIPLPLEIRNPGGVPRTGRGDRGFRVKDTGDPLIPCLRKAFPGIQGRGMRRDVHDAIRDLHVLRNRIAHHEPIHNRPWRRCTTRR